MRVRSVVRRARGFYWLGVLVAVSVPRALLHVVKGTR